MMEGLTEEVFRELHSPQLQAIGFPEALIATLYAKLRPRSAKGAGEDLSRYFEICRLTSATGACSETVHVSSSTGFLLRSKVRIRPGSDVFIVPHAWESDGGRYGREQLLKDPQLLAKIEMLLGIEHNGQIEHQDFEKIGEEIVELVCKQSGRSSSVARKALVGTGYDVIAAIVAAGLGDLSEADCTEEEKESDPAISFEEFKKGLLSMAGSSTTVPDGDARHLYEDYLKSKPSGPVEDDSGWVHCRSYSWTDAVEGEEGTSAVSVPLPAGISKRDITSKLQVRHWKLEVRDRTGERKTVLDHDFAGPVIPDESFWTLDGNVLSMNLQKAHPGEKWRSLFMGEVQLGRGEVEKLARFVRQRLVARVQWVLERMWLVNQTYQAVTPEGQMSAAYLVYSIDSTVRPPQLD